MLDLYSLSRASERKELLAGVVKLAKLKLRTINDTYKENDWWIADQCDGCGQLPLVSTTVPPSAPVSVLTEIHSKNETVDNLKTKGIFTSGPQSNIFKILAMRMLARH